MVASFHATLEEVNEADLLLHVIDASHPNWKEQRYVVDQVLAELGAAVKPVLYVPSEVDALPRRELNALRERIGNLLPNSAVFGSSMADGGSSLCDARSWWLVRLGKQLVHRLERTSASVESDLKS